MSRPSLKRVIDLCDSPASSTPPQPPAKRAHYGPSSSCAPSDDASSDCFAVTPRDVPSDSPSNPFGRVKPYIPRELPRPQALSAHLILRFRLMTSRHNVSRVACVPSNYTFYHLARLTQFLFGWRDVKTERNPLNRRQKVLRRAEHAFCIEKDVTMFGVAKHVGLIKSSRTAVQVVNSRRRYSEKVPSGVRVEREECYTLRHVWHRPGSSSELTRAIIYNYDTLSGHKQCVCVSVVSGDAEKLRLRAQKQHLSDPSEEEEESNTPYVLNGCGLPGDEEDDDDEFALDLQQWNEPGAFEAYMDEQDAYFQEKRDDGFVSPTKLAEEQARVKRRMSAPLPKRLPIDDDFNGPENASQTQAQAPAKKPARVFLPAKCAAPVVRVANQTGAVPSPSLDDYYVNPKAVKKERIVLAAQRARKTLGSTHANLKTPAVQSEEEI